MVDLVLEVIELSEYCISIITISFVGEDAEHFIKLIQADEFMFPM